MKETIAILAAFTLIFAGCAKNSPPTETSTPGFTSEPSVMGDDNNTGLPETTLAAEKELTAENVFENIKAGYGGEPTYGEEENTGGVFFASMPLSEEQLDGYGLTADMYDECVGATSPININPDFVIVTKAKPDKTDAVEGALESIREGFVNDTMQYPMNVEKVAATSVTREGDFFALILAGEPDTRENATESERLEFAKRQNEIGVNAFRESFN
ncbi:MAG: DUF4358 domain-containing protein [Eubacterium sp.]|jgi:hypothetical protein|nr:DUF4358 domain-containing protein [Eubacterium sp.]